MSSGAIQMTHDRKRCRRLARGLFRIVALWPLLLVLGSCASKEQKKSTDYSDLKMGQRIVKQMRDPHAIKSPFQKDVYNASRAVKTSNFKAGDYQGKRGFTSGRDNFKAGTFSQADKSSASADKGFAGAGEKSKWGGSSYATSQNRDAGRASPSAGEASTLGDDQFQIRTNSEAMRGTTNVKRPLILEDEPGYSEDFIKKLLNKG